MSEAQASIERLRREARFVKDRLRQAYDKIAVLEKAAVKPARQRKPARKGDSGRR